MSPPAAAHRASALAACLLGVVLGAALQLQQPRLWDLYAYVAVVAAAAPLLLAALRWRTAPAARWLAVLAAASALSAGVTGWRAAAYAAGRLDPALEGRELLVTGIVAALPHRNEAGLRFRFEAESAFAGGEEVRIPPQLMLGWYGGAEALEGVFSLERQPAELRAGERWQLALRLKAPHGNVNPHGFDYELWLWEQGVQATGSVRAGLRDPPPRRLASTWRHPVEQARQRVRDAIYARVEDPRLAGVLAALVAGDQGAIELGSCDYVVLHNAPDLRGERFSDCSDRGNYSVLPDRTRS